MKDEKETCRICSQDYFKKDTRDHQCPDMGCLDCEFITNDPEEFEAHYCLKYISEEQLAKVISILDGQKKEAK